MKKKWPSKWFWLTLGAPVLILLSLIVKPLLVQVAGQTVMIETVPYDPRSLFYGDYVDLDFEISHVEKAKVDPAISKQKQSIYKDELPVYVRLTPKGKTYTVERVTLNKPSQGLFIRGRVSSYEDEGKYRVTYPIEKYYVQERTGRQLEKWARQGKLLVQLKVYDGYAIVTGIKKVSVSGRG